MMPSHAMGVARYEQPVSAGLPCHDRVFRSVCFLVPSVPGRPRNVEAPTHHSCFNFNVTFDKLPSLPLTSNKRKRCYCQKKRCSKNKPLKKKTNYPLFLLQITTSPNQEQKKKNDSYRHKHTPKFCAGIYLTKETLWVLHTVITQTYIAPNNSGHISTGKACFI